MIETMGTFSDWFSPATRFRHKATESQSMSGGRAEQPVPRVGGNLPARVFLVLLLLALVVAWSYTLGAVNDFVMALAIILASLFAVAAGTSALTLRAPSWLLGTAGIVGLLVAAIGVYFRIEEPDGILTPLLIPLGGGIVVAELAIAANRYWNSQP